MLGYIVAAGSFIINFKGPQLENGVRNTALWINHTNNPTLSLDFDYITAYRPSFLNLVHFFFNLPFSEFPDIFFPYYFFFWFPLSKA